MDSKGQFLLFSIWRGSMWSKAFMSKIPLLLSFSAMKYNSSFLSAYRRPFFYKIRCFGCRWKWWKLWIGNSMPSTWESFFRLKAIFTWLKHPPGRALLSDNFFLLWSSSRNLRLVLMIRQLPWEISIAIKSITIEFHASSNNHLTSKAIIEFRIGVHVTRLKFVDTGH